jgi:hypothetical protein
MSCPAFGDHVCVTLAVHTTQIVPLFRKRIRILRLANIYGVAAPELSAAQSNHQGRLPLPHTQQAIRHVHLRVRFLYYGTDFEPAA